MPPFLRPMRLCAGCRAGAENQQAHLGDGWSPGGSTRDLGCLRCHTAFEDDLDAAEEVQGEPNAESRLTQMLSNYMEDEESQEKEEVEEEEQNLLGLDHLRLARMKKTAEVLEAIYRGAENPATATVATTGSTEVVEWVY